MKSKYVLAAHVIKRLLGVSVKICTRFFRGIICTPKGVQYNQGRTRAYILIHTLYPNTYVTYLFVSYVKVFYEIV